jgi:hypothetical protein
MMTDDVASIPILTTGQCNNDEWGGKEIIG